MKRALTIFLALSIAFVLIYVYFGKSKPKIKMVDWQEETLLSQDCGLEGLQCCVGDKTACDGDLSCCSDPSGSGANYCSNKCAFGEKGNFCRQEDPRCDTDLACADNRCQECGVAGGPCCLGADKCKSSDNERLECSFDGICGKCGSRNAVACRLGDPCVKGNIFNNNFCLPCGEYNTPCCNKSAGVDYECSPASRAACTLGFCN